MADRVLPSREDVRLVLDREYDEYAKSVGWLLMGAYAEGRLVDREAIDYSLPDNLTDEERIGWQAAMERVATALEGMSDG